MGLIGAGLVSLPSVMRAEESTNAVLTSLSATTLSGYVDTSANWNFGTGNGNLPNYTPNVVSGTTKADGFNFNVVALTLSKPAGDGWSAGYNATLLFGPDAVGYNTSPGAANSDFSLKDTYVDLHAPIGNGLDFKLGTFTEVLGYEVYETGNNPNYTRSYGYMIEPSALTGLMASYQITSDLSATAAICDTWSAGINSRSFPPSGTTAESFKTYMGGIIYTFNTNSGFLSGSTITGGAINGYDVVNQVIKTSLYGGGSFNTPITGVKVGVAYDYAMLGQNNLAAGGAHNNSGYQWAGGLYVNWQATQKLSFNTRGEYVSQSAYLVGSATAAGLPQASYEVTETIQYDLWKNVIARAEFRWDHSEYGIAYGSDSLGNPKSADAYLLAANFVYKF
jgi:hypothetical protein